METGRPLNPNIHAAREVAVRLLTAAGAPYGSPAGVVAQAGGTVLQRMRHTLVRWFGPDGFHALLLRALDRSREVCPALDAVTGQPLARDGGLSISPDAFAALASLPPGEAMDACTTAIAEVIAVLRRLVGADLAWRLVEYSWPEEESVANPPSPGRAGE